MVAFNKVKVGDVLYDCHREKMGNTTMSRIGCWEVRVLEVNTERREAFCSWNSNPAQWWSERRLRALRWTKVKYTDPFARARAHTKGE